MATSVSKAPQIDTWRLALGGMGLSLLVGAVTSLGSPSFIAIGVAAVLGGAFLLVRPEAGVLLLFTTFLFKYPPELLEGLGRLTPNNLLGLALSLILFARVAVQKQFWFLRVRQVQIFLLIGAVIFVNWFFVGHREAPDYLSHLDSTEYFLSLFVTRAAFFIFFIAFIQTPRHLLLIHAVFLFALFLTVPEAILHALTGVGKVESIRAAATAGIGLAKNPNFLAFLALLAISLIWYALQEYRTKLLSILGGLAILALILTVLLSGSRAALLNLLLLPFIVLFQSGTRRGREIVVVVLFIVLSVSASSVLIPQTIMERLFTFSSENREVAAAGSTDYRLRMLHLGYRRFTDNPLIGVGVGNVRWVNATDPITGGIPPFVTHNAYLLALAEGGLLYLGAYLLLLWQAFQDLGKAQALSARAPGGVRLQWLILATRTNLVLLMFFSFFADSWPDFYYFLILGTAAVLVRIYQEAKENSRTNFSPVCHP